MCATQYIGICTLPTKSHRNQKLPDMQIIPTILQFLFISCPE